MRSRKSGGARFRPKPHTTKSQKRACKAYPPKIRYADHDSAVQAMQRLEDKVTDRDVSNLRAYECGGCKGWHLTSQPIEGDR